MRYLIAALALGLASPAFAAAGTPYTIHWNPQSTALPVWTTADVKQDFTTTPFAPNGSTYVPETVPNVFEESIKLVQPNNNNSSNANEAPRVAYYNTVEDGVNDGLAQGRNGMDGQYIGIVNGAEYTIEMLAHPSQFFSFVFNSLDTDDKLVLTYSDGSQFSMNGFDILNGPGIIGGQTPKSIPGYPDNWGRVSYDMGGNPGIVSAAFSSGSHRWYIDSIAFAAPEPAAWAMMILGFGLAGSQIRRRRRSLAAA